MHLAVSPDSLDRAPVVEASAARLDSQAYPLPRTAA
jgi:hypothetical protein